MTDTTKQKEIRLRQRLVFRYLLRKVPIDEIAEKVGVDEKTVDRDIQVIRSENNKLMEQGLLFQGSIQELVQDHLLSMDEVLRELWTNYYQDDVPVKTKTNILKAIADVSNKKLELMQELGLAPRQAIKIQEVKPEKSSEVIAIEKEFNEFMHQKYVYPKGYNSSVK